MNLWSSLRSLFSVAANNSTSSRKGKKALELKPRNHLIEQCEDRVLLSVSPTGLDDVYGSEAIRQAIISASNLDRYDSVDMSSVTKWVVGVSNRTDISAMAGKYGATNLGETILNNSYVWEFSTNTAWETAANYLQNATGVDYFYPLVPLSLKTMAIDDPLYQYQWNLDAFSSTNAGINVEGAWLYVTGAGVSIAVVDQGTEYTHEDLAANYNPAISYDFIDYDTDPAPEYSDENHGTSVTGIIVASNNGLGGVGVAYDATFGNIRLIGNNENFDIIDTDANDYANALTYALDSVDIYNNSHNCYFGTYSGNAKYSYENVSPLIAQALETGVNEGRDGKGAIYVFCAGNEGRKNVDVNMSMYTNSRYTIAVGAVNPDGTKCNYSNTGASLLVVAPAGGAWESNEDGTGFWSTGTTTTDRTGEEGYNRHYYEGSSDYEDLNYTNDFNGTSASTPVVSGVVALMLEANPSLTWRDVQQILVETSVQVDASNEDWTTNGAGYNISYNYGFGLVNAKAAVEKALTWENLPDEIHTVDYAIDTPVTIGKQCTSTISITDKSISSLETVEITVDITHPSEGDLQIELISPDGTVSVLARSREVINPYGGYDNYTFTTKRCWGESALGEWTLRITDNGEEQTGVLNSWSLGLYGNQGDVAHVGPDVVSVFPDAGDSLINSPTLDYAPNQLTVRFTEGQEIDPNTLDAIKLMYRQNEGSEWEEVSLGWIGIGEQPNEVILRPASTFLDGLYELIITGTGDSPLLNNKGFEFRYDPEKDAGSDYTFDFAMTLPLQVTAVVPMPVVDGEVKGDQIEVYFNADKTDNTYYTEPQYYTLFATQDTASSIDDYHVNPDSVELDTVVDAAGHTVMRATLTFSDDINKIFGIYGSYRLKVGEKYNYSDTEEFDDVDGEDFEAGDAFRTSKDVSGYFATTNDVYSSLIINGNIDVKKANEAIQAMIYGGGLSMEEIEALAEQMYDYDNRWPGGNDEPGHEMRTTSLENTANVEQHIMNWDFDSYDAEPGVVTYFYCFPKKNGSFNNYVTEQQKNSVRQIFQLLGDSCGIQFFELKTPDDGSTVTSVTYKDTNFPVISFFVSDLALMGGDSGPGGVAGLGGGTTACLDLVDFGNTNNCEYGSGFYSVAMHEIMHCLSQGHTYDLDGSTIMGASTKEFYTGSEESVFPAPADVVHLQYMFRNDSLDVDMYAFTLQQSGTLELETIARRLEMGSALDTVLNLYDENGTLIATNDNYFGLDSLIEVSLKPGKYYVGVSSAGNEDYDPINIKTGMNGTTEGEYQLKLSFTPAQKASTLLNFDGDMDGKVGGDFNFWFDVQKDENILYVDKTGEFTPDNGTTVYTQIDEAIADAAAMIEQFKADGSDERVIVRILANNTDSADLTQRQAYEIGTYTQGGSTTILEDGAKLEIPKGVSVVVEQGAVIKLANTNITAGSQSAIGPVNNVLDQTPAGTIQLLGAPNEKVYLTSYWDETIGSDSYTQTTTPKSGDWGGIVLTNVKEHEYNESETAKVYGKVKILEDEGVFINYIGFADISYGGGEVNVNGFKSIYAPVYLDEARPTILSNTITSSMTAAISADPNSFEESHIYGQDEFGDWFTADYDRVGPTIHNNTLVKTHDVKNINKATGEITIETVTSSNSVNGLAIRTTTPSQSIVTKLDVTARFDDWDITHVIQEDLILASAAGGSVVYIDPRGNTSVKSRTGGSLRIDDNVLIKLGNSRIELEDNTNLIAEGDKGDEIIFTSIYDDKYGYGGTFDATNNGFNADSNPNAAEYNPQNNDYLTGGNWGGLYLGHSSTASLDNIKLMYAGGQSRIEGYFVNFQPIEVVQADLRVTNSYFAYNSAATEASDRIGRGNVTNPAVIYVRNAQPIIVDNNFAANETAIISINANALTANTVKDYGRQTGLLIQQEEGAKYDNLYPEYASNYGPLVRENEFNDNLYNGMVVRGEVLTTESIWDDVDIVHILQDEIVVGNHHTYSGIRLQSSTTGSLVVKLFGANAGFTAAGAPNDVEDRIGGTVQVMGNAIYPVILTSLYDNSYGAGYDQWGNSVTNTYTATPHASDDDPDGAVKPYVPEAGNWRSIKFQQYSNDRNVAVVVETEGTYNVTNDVNNILSKAQNLGSLANNINGGDENNRLGFDIHGTIHSNRDSADQADSDVYSFKAIAGTDIWVDVDLTRYALDTVVELLDSNGNVVARNDRSEDLTSWLDYTAMVSEELRNLADLQGKTLDNISPDDKKESNFRENIVSTMQQQFYVQYYQDAGEVEGMANARVDAEQQYSRMTGYDWTRDGDPDAYLNADGEYQADPDPRVTSGYASSMNIDIWERNSNDDYGLNEKDSGFKVTLPGVAGVETQYYLRVKSNVNSSNTSDNTSAAIADLAGRTYGEYTVQIRLRETQEKAGCTVQYAQIFYATNGIEVIGTPSSSPLTVDMADVEIGITGKNISPDGIGQNDTIRAAQNIGNVLETTHGSMSLTGYIASAHDIDWYKFEVKIPNQQDIPGVSNVGNGVYPLTIDIDYSDGMGRANVNLWLFDASGTLVASSTGSNITGDQATPFTGADSSNLETGSGGTSDPYIGTFYVPEGTYYVAVAPQHMTPAALSQRLLREESVDSVERIVEDDMSNHGWTNLPVDTTYTLNFKPEAYSLADVRMYLGNNKTLYSNNSFTGAGEVNWGGNHDHDNDNPSFNDVYGDYVMRSDGQMYAIDNKTGTRQIINLEDAGQRTDAGVLGTIAYSMGEDGLERIDDYTTGIRYEAIVFAHENGTSYQYTNRPMFVIGNLTRQIAGVDFNQNLLYMVNNDGTVHSLEGGQDAAAKAGTNDVPLSYLLSGLTLKTKDASDPSTDSTLLDLRDGHQLTFKFEADSGLDDVIVEFDTGVDLMVDPMGGLKIRDTQTFTVGGKTFEFDSGQVLEIAQDPAVVDGDQLLFVNINEENPQPKIIFFSNSTLPEADRAKAPEGSYTVVINDNESSMSLMRKIVAQLNKAGITAIAGWDDANENMAQDDEEIGRISFNSLFTYTSQTAEDWVEQVGFNGRNPDGPQDTILIPFTEWATGERPSDVNAWLTKLDQSICDAINQNVPGVYASFFHRDVTQDENGNLVPSIGDRITIYNLAADEFDAGDTTVFTHRENVTGGLSGAGVTEGQNVIRVRVDADYPADQISRLINRAIENFKLENREYEDAIQTTVTGKYIMFTGELSTVTANDNEVFVFDGDINANGGKLTGLAWVGNDLYAVSENGDLYRITYEGGSMANFDVRDENNGNDFHDTFRFNTDNEEMDAAETDWDVIYESRKDGDQTYLSLCDNTYREKKFNLELIACLGKNFTGLTNGPENVEDGLYADLLFATDNNGVVYCFDTVGEYKGVFSNGAYSIETGRGGAVGIDFTTQDFNMWHRTNIRQDEAGHKINKTFDYARKSDADGNASYYFGMEDPYTDIYIGYDQGSVTNTLQAYVTNSGLYSTYNAAGGTHGSLVSDEFSLTNISSDDQPFMTFEYYLDSESSEIYDSFRIYIRSTDPLASQLVGQNATTIGNKMNPQGYDTMAAMLTAANGQWIMLGTNLDNDLPDNDSNYLHTNKPTSKIGYDVVDLGGGWYQAKIDLSDYAGLSNLQLKLDFTTQSSDFVGDLSTTGELLYGTEGLNVFSGDQIAIDNEVFTFNTGEKVLVLSAPASRMSGNMSSLIFTSDEVGQVQIDVFKATDYQEPGVDFTNIYITDSTTASEFAGYLTEALNNFYADAAACAEQIENDILTAGHKSTAARDIVGLNKGLTLNSSSDDLLTVVGTDTIEFTTINTAVVNNGGRAENPEGTNFISLVNRPFSITDIYGQEVEYTVVPSQQSKTGYYVEALTAGEDEPELIEVASIYDIATAVSEVSDRGGVSAYICENSMVVRCAAGVTVGAGMASSSSRGNDIAGAHTIDVNYSMTSYQVSSLIADALEAEFATSETIDTPDGSYSTKVDDLWTVVKINGGVDNNGNDTGFNDQLHVINHVITSPGFLSAASMQWGDARVRASYVWQSGEIGAYETHQDNGLRKHQGQDNAYEGVFVDNFCISLGGRGTMYTNVAANTTLNSGTPSGPTSGYYLLNIRTATDYGTFDVDNQALNLTRTFRATDRLDGGLTMVSPEGGAINHLQTFSIGDGNSEQRFVMVNMDIVNTEISDGLFVDFEEWWDYNVAQEIVRESDFYIQYHSSYSSYDMAAAIAAAVNSQYLYTVNDPTYRAFSVRAKHSDGSNHVDLYGATWIKGITAVDSDCGDAIISEMTGKIVGYTGLKALSYINYGAETATYQDFVGGKNEANDKTLLHGDANVTNGQGQIVLSNNLIAYSSGYGIYSAGNKAVDSSSHKSDVFQLESKADSKYKIYLDFTGHIAVGTSWNGGAEVVTPTYDSNYDLIYEVWQRVAEDFMPWDVNVTTIEPEGDSCAQKGVLRVCIGGSWSDWYGKSAGGVAFLNSFTWDSDTPAYVFADNLGSAKSIAEAASHEIGHTFGLSHDGDPTNEYYGGANGWAPIMGVGYSQVLTQWSKGEYPGATNKEDDVKIITDVIISLQRTDPDATNTMGVRPDDHSDGNGNATDLGDIEQATSGDIAAGIITTKDDVDWFVFTVSEDCTQKVTIGGIDLITNLDCGVRLYNDNGAEITDPTVIQESGLKYIINLDQLVISQAGMFEDGVATFRLSVEGTRSSQATTGDSITTGSTGNYSDYASLGSYTISIQVPATDVQVDPDAPDAIFPGFIVPFSTINDERWVPSTVAYNNILAFNETGGIFFGGNSNAETIVGTVPYGRIVNNTIWGTKEGDTGILVGSNATATVLNNVVANCGAGISMDGTASSSIVSGYNAYYSNNVNTSGGAALGSNAILLRSGEPLFVNPDKLNFYPEADSRIIDASANVLAQRAEMDKLYDRLGISTSPIQAPDTDIYGQLRADDPNVQNSSGVGANVYKDRGAVERIDWVGPVATIINPVDLYNTAPSTKLTDDSDLNRNDVVLTGVSLSNFILDFIDEGVGIDDDTVSEKSFTIYRILNGYEKDENGNYIDAKAEFDNGSPYVEKLRLTYDYLFRYNATLDRVTFIPVTGAWTLGYTYQIEIDCNSASPYCIYDLAGNELQPNRTSGTQVGRTIFNVSLSGMNFGDAPDKPAFPDYSYQTFLANDGPAHVIIPGFSLGQTVSATADAIVNKDANSSADDDGLEFKFKDAMLSRKEDNKITVTVRNDAIAEEDAATTVAGYVCMWIDVDGDGTWNSSGDFFTMQAVYVGENEFSVSATDLAGGADETFLRARLFTVDTISEAVASGADFTQWFAGSRDSDGNYIVNPVVLGGEVEDYRVYLVDNYLDYGDAAQSYGSASHIVDNESGDYIYLGTEDELAGNAGVDAEYVQHSSQNATGDDLYGKLDPNGDVINDEQGVVFNEESLTSGEYVRLTVNTANTLGTGYLYVWIDVNSNGIFETDECVLSDYAISGTGQTEIVTEYQLPHLNGNYTTSARVRFSAETLTDVGSADASGRDLGSIGFGGANATRGEVEDYQVVMSEFFYDYGDAEDTYQTLAISSGAYHLLTPRDSEGNRATIGRDITFELDGKPSSMADADEDDGISVDSYTGYIDTAIVVGATVQLPVSVTGEGYLLFWIDVNRDGTFSDSELIPVDSVLQRQGTDKFEEIPKSKWNATWGYEVGSYTGVNEASDLLVNLNIPENAKVGEAAMRVRFYELSNDFASLMPAASGFGGFGEVEDYMVFIQEGSSSIEGYKFNDVNNNGIYDVYPESDTTSIEEDGLKGAAIYIDANNNGVWDDGYEQDGKWVPAEIIAVTNPFGYYKFDNLISGTYVVREIFNIDDVSTSFTSTFVTDGEVAEQAVIDWFKETYGATLHTIEESNLYLRSYPQRVASIPENDASNVDVPISEKAFSLEFLDDGNMSLDGCHVYITNYGTNYVDGNPVTYDFVLTNVPDMVSYDSTKIYVYFDPSIENPMNELAKNFASAVNTLVSSKMTATFSDNRVTINSGVFDLRVSNGGEKLLPTEDIEWFNILTSHSMPGENLSDGGYQVVVVTKEGDYSGVNFGSFRKPEVAVHQTDIYAEGNTGWHTIQVPVIVTKSFGSEFDLYYETTDGTAKGYGDPANPYDGNNPTVRAQATPLAPEIDFIHTSGTLHVQINADEIQGGGWQVSPVTVDSSSDNYETAIAGDYIVFRAGKDIHYIDTRTAWSEETGYVTINDITRDGEATDDAYLTARQREDGSVLVVWSKQDPKTLHWSLYYYVIGESTSESQGSPIPFAYSDLDYYAPVIGDTCIYYFVAEKAGSTAGSLYSLEIGDNYENLNSPSGSTTLIAEGAIPIESLHVNQNIDKKDFNAKANGVVFTVDNQVYYKEGVASASASLISANGVKCYNPQIDGDFIVWEEDVSGISTRRLVMYTISTGEQTVIRQKQTLDVPGKNDVIEQKVYTTNNVKPAINNGMIVWEGDVYALNEAGQPCKTTEILLYDIASKNTIQLSDGTGRNATPSINGSLISWTHEITKSNGQLDKEVVAYDLDSQSTSLITRQGNDWEPLVCNEEMIIWRGEAKTSGSYELYLASVVEPYYVAYVDVWVYGDTIVEPDEYFYMNISTVEDDVIVHNDQTQVWLLNDDSNHSDKVAMDYGDAPSTYKVTLEKNGARHDISDYKLGASITYEKTANSNSDATGDKGDDGVAELQDKNNIKTFVSGMVYTLTVTASIPETDADGSAYLDAWIDFNGDGLWTDDERIADSAVVVNGANEISFMVPYTSYSGKTYARFRLSDEGGLDSVGYAATGEVEDYKVAVAKNSDSNSRTLTITSTAAGEAYEMKLVNGGSDFIVTKTVSGVTQYAKFASNKLTWVDTENVLEVSSFDLVKISNSTGDSTFKFTGQDSGEEIYKLYQNKGFIYSNGLNVNVSGMAYMNVNTRGGSDKITLLGSNSQDLFQVGNASATVSSVEDGTAYYNVTNIDSTAVVMCYGESTQNDSVEMYTVEGTTSKAEFTRNDLVISDLTGGVYRKSIGFKNLAAYASNADDEVVFNYVTGTIDFTVDPITNTDKENTFYQEAYGFSNPEAKAVSSSARIRVAAQEDGELVVSPTQLVFTGVEQTITAQGFSNVEFDGAGYDISAALYDSEGDDLVTMYKNNVQMKGANYLNVVKNVKFVNAYSTSGNDTAKIYDTADVNYLYAQAYSTTIFDAKKTYSNSATGFKTVQAYATTAGSKAFMYDSVGNDVLVSTSTYTAMSGNSYSNKVYGYSTVNVASVNGGNDVARMYDSAVDDVLSAGTDWAQIDSADLGMTRKVSNFGLVEAVATNAGSKTVSNANSARDYVLNTFGWDD